MGLSLCGISVAQNSAADLTEARQWTQLSTELEKDSPALGPAQPDGTTALHWSAFHGNVDATAALLSHGSDPNALNDYDVSPLSLACENGHADVVKLLIAAGADVEQKRLGGERPLMLAAIHGDAETVRLLIKAKVDLDARERNGQTALMWAAAQGNVFALEQMLTAGADKEYSLKSGFNPMMFAARNGHPAVIGKLIEHGYDVNATMKPKKTGGRHPRDAMSPLMLAIESGHLELALQLVQWGADPNDQRSGFAPLHAITWVRRANRGDDPAGDPPPRITGNVNSLEFVRRIVAAGAKVNLQLDNDQRVGKARLSPGGATPFLFASGTCDLPLMELLLELGADPKINNADDCTALMAAAGVGVIAVDEYPGSEEEVCAAIKMLNGLGIPIDHVDKNKETAMHGAAYRTFPRAVATIAQLGADPNIWNQKNKHGWTPFDIALGKRPGSVKPSPETTAALESAQ